MKTIVSTLLIFISFTNIFAQSDTSFWFVAPDISTNFETPIVFRVTNPNPQAVAVYFTQPANPSSLVNHVLIIPGNTSFTDDMSSLILDIENTPANAILNNGIHISSTDSISIYYEANNILNPDIFVLKGASALGNKFYVAMQNFWNNSSYYSPTPYSSFEIVATENNTTVNITPVTAIVGHAAATSFSIILNKGQTYSAKATGQLASDHLSGSKIESDKPIAVTVSDDLITNPGGCADLSGDQIIPVNNIGSEYIVMKGLIDSTIAQTHEKAFVIGTANNTAIYINGSSTPTATINEGSTYSFDIINQAVYIKTSKPVYVWHTSGFECELAGAVLPSIECTGSNQVSFTRSTQETFALMIMTKNGLQGNFQLNGSATLIPASTFTTVSGTNGKWVVAQIQFSTTDVRVDSASIVKNTGGLFHLGIINGGVHSGCRYGYFSGYASFQTDILPDSLNICKGEQFILDAGENENSYLWNDGSATQTFSANSQGEYWVQVINKQGCSLHDTTTVVYKKESLIEILPVNVFTPNNDKINDTFDLLKGDAKPEQFHLQIFNRWGNLVFESSDPDIKWDGKENGENISEGTYYWSLQYQSPCTEESKHTEKGFVTLMR